jgi:hypothetical protein
MLQFWIEGGWGMFPVTAFGVVMVLAAGRFALDGELVRLRFVGAMGAVLVAAMIHAMLTDVAAVFSYLSDPSRAPDGELARALCTGLMESTRPGALGGALLVLALVLVAVGVSRSTARELRLRAATA